MSKRITIWPKVLQCEAVDTTTSPVTQVLVVAVKSASIKGVGMPFLALMGNVNKTAPTKIATKKLSIIIWVVEKLIFRFFIKNNSFLH